MKCLRRHAINAFNLAVGGFLWVIGMGGVEKTFGCKQCGREVAGNEEAWQRHIAAFHADTEVIDWLPMSVTRRGFIASAVAAAVAPSLPIDKAPVCKNAFEELLDEYEHQLSIALDRISQQSSADYPYRVGDSVNIDGKMYEITQVYPGETVTLDGVVLPWASVGYEFEWHRRQKS